MEKVNSVAASNKFLAGANHSCFHRNEKRVPPLAAIVGIRRKRAEGNSNSNTILTDTHRHRQIQSIFRTKKRHRETQERERERREIWHIALTARDVRHFVETCQRWRRMNRWMEAPLKFESSDTFLGQACVL